MIPIVMAVMMAFGLYLGKSFTAVQPIELSKGQANYQKIKDIVEILDQQYVDEVDAEKLFEQTIGDILHNLDPHSNYISAQDIHAMNEQIEGKFGGVGVRFFIIRDTVCVTGVLPGSPSERAGLKAGDKFLEVDGKKVASQDITNEDVMAMLKGIENTPVKVKIVRNGKKMNKEIIRGGIPIASVVSWYMVQDDIGYLRISNFSKTTSAEFRSATAKMLKKGMKKLILDVRSNGGGVLTGATEIADEFLKNGESIVVTKGEHVEDVRYMSSARGNLKNTELVILINSNSASASEILAGAIQDNDRGTIIGRRSFGKGLVQQDFELDDGSNLRLVVARYYTPTGRCIQKPYSGNIEEYYEDSRDRYDSGEMFEVDSASFADSLKFKTPKGKVVYGGGGIMPDIFVPYDTSGSSFYFSRLRYSPAFTTFAFDYVQNKRSKWKSSAAFRKSFVVTDALIKQFTDYTKKEFKIGVIPEDLAISKELIRREIKGEIARQLWAEFGYFQVINDSDPEVNKGVQYLKK
ncbi:MAG: carboxyl-terminal processing protease [Flavobacteriaceae bacterium]|jgi:carboxyl-terminal processing protease